jgi:FtsH-binding integral membrane protein
MQYAKAYAALIGSICTALLGVYAADSGIGKALTVISVVATAVATFGVKNAPANPNDDGCVNLGPVLTVMLIVLVALVILAFVGVRVHVG